MRQSQRPFGWRQGALKITTAGSRSKISQLCGVEAQCHIDFRQPINPGSSFG
jgi:hypothetical protein